MRLVYPSTSASNSDNLVSLDHKRNVSDGVTAELEENGNIIFNSSDSDSITLMTPLTTDFLFSLGHNALMTQLTTPTPTPSPLEKPALKPTRILARECPPSPLISPQGLHVPLVSKSLNEVAIN